MSQNEVMRLTVCLVSLGLILMFASSTWAVPLEDFSELDDADAKVSSSVPFLSCQPVVNKLKKKKKRRIENSYQLSKYEQDNPGYRKCFDT